MSTNIIISTDTKGIDQELEHLDISQTLLNSISSEVREAALPTILDPPHLNLTQTIINDPWEEPFASHINPTLFANALKNLRSATPPDSFQVINITDVTPLKKRYHMKQDPVFINSGLMPPILQPFKTP